LKSVAEQVLVAAWEVSMRVLQVHNRYRQPGGEDAAVQAEANVLRKAGHDVVQYFADNPRHPAGTAVSLAMAAWNPHSVRGLRQLVERERPDIAHVHNTWFSLSPSVVAALDRCSIPVVMTLHNYRLLCANAMLLRDGKPCEKCVGTHPWHSVRHRCYRDSAVASAAVATTIAVRAALDPWARHVRVFVAPNEFARQRFITGGLNPEKIVVKPNFVSDPGPRPAPPSRSDVALYVGRLFPEKGAHVLLEAWERLQGRQMRLVVVGDGPMRDRLQKRWAEVVSFTGPLPPYEVRRLMLESRALVFPSMWYEVQPLTVLEALAAGLPVLASRLGGNVDLLRTGGDDEDWLVPAGDVEGWTAALERLADGEHVDAAGAVARQRYEAQFSDSDARSKLEAVYSIALGGG
jgi:glycosyltransferase involved in cell wall biosynthesis